MERYQQAIYLLADSQLLFWHEDGKLFIESIRTSVRHDSPKAAYVGASNGDNPDYYSLFVATKQTSFFLPAATSREVGIRLSKTA
jgi:hypothetical protein